MSAPLLAAILEADALIAVAGGRRMPGRSPQPGAPARFAGRGQALAQRLGSEQFPGQDAGGGPARRFPSPAGPAPQGPPRCPLQVCFGDAEQPGAQWTPVSTAGCAAL